MDKQSAIALGVTAGLGVGYLLGKAQPSVPRVKAGQKPTTDLDEVERLIRPNILSLTPYRCARDDYDQGILLDANENSLGPPLQGHSQLQAMELERYPCPYQPELKNVITDFRNQNSTEKISQANAFLGVGSDEAIDLIIRVACTPRVDNIMITPPTYGMYSVCANIHDVGIVSVPLQIEALAENLKGLKPDLPLPAFHIDPQEILNAATDSTKVIFLCSPGNPTANVLRLEDVETILNSKKYKGFVVVDEAYIDFSDTASLCTLVNKHRRLIVLQTLSKGFGLAGIRLGVAFGDPKLIQVLNNVKAPYNISKLTSDVARKAFSNLDELRKNVNLIKEEKYRVIKELQKLSFVRCIYASDSNFVLFEIPHALSVYRQMAGRGVVIRYRGNQHLLTDCLRATIGSREENDRMLELLVEVYGEQ
ncbi:histidinol-phosphate transaminase [Phytophthora nicotianae INRA-310]|uniref:histidinol-phosphate transaminase n=2 Tax=Phytophthora nicotianae TaxID=4792 RepID=W2Q2C7_PHYN3|nr:histidinol-phosphate transaminase [Phytophthora nicotianae INRA-310]ETN07036.1 histidinol-phosphate transaminase [Phytophthora nicotianae INRA-310]ETO72468.1 histidinol-phosphate transaminase [Phytophthora nicotianae P1976]